MTLSLANTCSQAESTGLWEDSGLDLSIQGQSPQKQSAGPTTEPALPALKVCTTDSVDLKCVFPVAREEEEIKPLGKAVSIFPWPHQS